MRETECSWGISLIVATLSAKPRKNTVNQMDVTFAHMNATRPENLIINIGSDEK
jgi:hypothetical protein